MMDGHAILFKNIDTDNRTLDTYILDKDGNETCIFQNNEIISMGLGNSAFDTRFSTGWFGEGLVAYVETTFDTSSDDFTSRVLGYMDSTGKTVIDLSDRGYRNAYPFHDGLACVSYANGEFGYIDKTGREVLSNQFDTHGQPFYGGLAAKEDRGSYGYIDMSGQFVIPPVYRYTFSGGDGNLLAVQSYDTGEWGLIDRDNNVVVPFEYDDISAFENGVAYAIKDGYVYIITKAAAKPTVGGFSDVYEGDYYADAVVWAVENDVTSGVGSGKFAPGNNCTREQIVTFLWRANGSPEPKTTANPFTDVGQSSYAYKAILWAVENDITSGTGNGKFSPGASCTRDQAVTFLWRSEGKPAAASGSSFTDVKTGDYFADAVAWAVANNITSGVGNNRFNPSGTCTRGQIVTFLYRNK